MFLGYWVTLIAMLFVPAGDETPNPWREKVAPAAEKARASGSADAYRTALEAAWRADDWQVGLELARETLQKNGNAPQTIGPAARALWRAGDLLESEKVVAKLPAKTTDKVALAIIILTSLSRGEKAPALAAADRLAEQPALTAEDLYYVIAARSASEHLAGIGDLVRKAQKLANADNGYPERYVKEQLEGTAEFFDAIGPEPVNRITAFGSTPMPPLALINLPGCDVMLNGHGPYRFIVDTGGSIMLSIDDEVAKEIGVKSVASGSIHGVAGKDAAGQALIDEARFGDATVHRVLTRIFGVRKSVAYAADGILGTGVFGDGRVTLDFLNGRMIVAASGDGAAAGHSVDVRIIGDAKLVPLVSLQGQPAAGILDTGADAFAIAPSRLKRIFPGRPIHSMRALALGVGSEQAPAISLSPGVDFEFAGRQFHNVGGLGLDVLDTLLGPMLQVQGDVLIGMPMMRQMKALTVDFARSKMWVDWLETE